MKSEFYVIAFESTHHAIMVEKKLKEKHKIDMIPTPREITASCGLSIKFSSELFKEINIDIERLNLSLDQMGIYKIERIDNKKVVTKIEKGED